ncbi:MAG: transcription/translation regulatory transformer protein RfaH [Gammaproteobacteria bacterium]|nr:transcription/translation regulatory transformer protein RfaH [Gammaproteobacteria bacterium]
MEQWYAIQTRVRQEQIAVENLSRQGYCCYFPRIKQWRKRRGKRYLVIEAFFPGYLFVSLDPYHANTAPIRSTRGVRGLVRFGQQLHPVPDEVIVSLKQRTDAEDVIELEPVDFKSGQEVRIEKGPLAGLTAIFQEKNGEERAILLLNLLGSERQVDIPIAILA